MIATIIAAVMAANTTIAPEFNPACLIMGNFAASVMTMRQEGVPVDDVLDAALAAPDPVVAQYLVGITFAAYDGPQYATAAERELAVELVREFTIKDCEDGQ